MMTSGTTAKAQQQAQAQPMLKRCGPRRQKLLLPLCGGVLLTVLLGLVLLSSDDDSVDFDVIYPVEHIPCHRSFPTFPPPPPKITVKLDSPLFKLQYSYIATRDSTSKNTTQQYSNLLCNYNSVLPPVSPQSTLQGKSENSTIYLAEADSDQSTNQNEIKDSFDDYVPYVIGISPTYHRLTQRSDLTSLCQTLMNVPRFLWIVVEDSETSTPQVEEILKNCQVESVLLHIPTSHESQRARQRGVEQRNLGLDWLRDHCNGCGERHGVCEGVVYFMDDDNVYSIRLFEHMRQTCSVSVFPVGLVGGMIVEGPECKDGKVERWRVIFDPSRHIPVDMAAFAVNLRLIQKYPEVRIGYRPDQVRHSRTGHMETDFLRSLKVSRLSVECRGAEDEVLVWHVKSTFKKVYEKESKVQKFKV